MPFSRRSERRNTNWFRRSVRDTSFEPQKWSTVTARRVPECEHCFVVKQLSRGNQESAEEFRRRVSNEIDIQHLLRSEFVPVLFNFHFLDDSRTLISMELASISLDKLLFYREQTAQPIPFFVIQRWSRFTFAGLDYLDQLGIVHRDLKPSNLLLVTSSLNDLELRHARVLISDFGSAQMRSVTYPEGNSNVTLQYSAPELLSASGYASARSDLFSLAIVLVKCATFQHVFMGRRIHSHSALVSLTDLRALFSERPQLVVGESSLYSTFMAPLRMLSPVPVLHFENDSLRLARDFRALVLACLRANPDERPTPRVALNFGFHMRRELQGTELVYTTEWSSRLRQPLSAEERLTIAWSAVARAINDRIGMDN